jgi:hypothetical protein
MAGSILLAASVGSCIGVSGSGEFKNRVIREIINLASFCAAGVIVLYVFGAFYGSSSGYGEGYGSFTSNLNTFINPLFGSIVLKPMKLYYSWQFEGYGYLGIGVILLSLFVIIYCLRERIKRRGSDKTGSGRVLSRNVKIAAVLLAVDMAMAVIPMFTFSDIKLFGIPMPDGLRQMMGIFRSNGRFIWVPMYLIMTGAIVYAYRILSEVMSEKSKGRSITAKLMILACLLQVLDTAYVVRDKQDYFKYDHTYMNIWSKVGFPASDVRYKEMVFLYNANDIIMDTAFYAYLTGRTINNYYYARNIDEEVNRNIAEWRSELYNGVTSSSIFLA